jgi:hypothetical protein
MAHEDKVVERRRPHSVDTVWRDVAVVCDAPDAWCTLTMRTRTWTRSSPPWASAFRSVW